MSWCCLMWRRLNQQMIEVDVLTVSHDGVDLKETSADTPDISEVLEIEFRRVRNVTVACRFGRDEDGTQTTNSEYR